MWVSRNIRIDAVNDNVGTAKAEHGTATLGLCHSNDAEEGQQGRHFGWSCLVVVSNAGFQQRNVRESTLGRRKGNERLHGFMGRHPVYR